MKKNGMEEIIHLFANHLERDSTLDVFCADGDNAFNAANRIRGLQEVKDHFPGALAYAKDMYLDQSTAWYYGLPDEIKPIFCKNGYHQGDVLASWLYVMTIQPLLHHIQTEMKRLYPNRFHLIKFYVDDGNFIAPFDMMLKIIEILQNSFHGYGYRLKMTKGHYLLGKCETPQEALARRQTLLDIGFHPSIIKIHPDNVTDENENAIDEARKIYGVKLLGAFVGTDQYIDHCLEEYFTSLVECAKSLMDYPDLQGRLLLFRYCFMSKPLFLMRTTRPDLMTKFIDNLQKLQRTILASIFKCDVSDSLFHMCCLRISFGGLGIHRADEVAPAAYTASWIAFLRTQGFDSSMHRIAGLHSLHQCPRLEALEQTIRRFKLGEVDANEGANAVPSIQEFVNKLHKINQFLDQQDRQDRETLQNKLTYDLQQQRIKAMKEFMTNNEDQHINLRWWNGLQNQEAGAWLDAIPKIDKLQMRSSEFRTALRYRYRIAISAIRAGSRCDCKVRMKQPNGSFVTCCPPLDPYGYHVSTGCGKDGLRIKTHDALVSELNDIIRYAGGNTVKEQRHCFGDHLPDDNHRPDIAIINPGAFDIPGNKALLDVTVTCPLEGAQNGKISKPTKTDALKKVSTSLTTVYRNKINKYNKVLRNCAEVSPDFNPNHFSIFPIAFESSGAIHAESQKFIDSIVEKAADISRHPGNNLVMYFKKKISVCLQKNIARTINSRVGKIMSHQDFRVGRDFADEIIADEVTNGNY